MRLLFSKRELSLCLGSVQALKTRGDISQFDFKWIHVLNELRKQDIFEFLSFFIIHSEWLLFVIGLNEKKPFEQEKIENRFHSR